MADTLTAREARDRQIFIDGAYERNPAAGKAVAIREGEATWRTWRGERGPAPVRRAPVPNAAIEAAVTAALTQAKAARKAAKRARRVTRESLAAVAPVAALLSASPAALAEEIRGLNSQELAETAAAGLGARGRSPFCTPRPGGAARRGGVTETGRAPAADPAFASMTIDELRNQAATSYSAGAEGMGRRTPFWKEPVRA